VAYSSEGKKEPNSASPNTRVPSKAFAFISRSSLPCLASCGYIVLGLAPLYPSSVSYPFTNLRLHAAPPHHPLSESSRLLHRHSDTESLRQSQRGTVGIVYAYWWGVLGVLWCRRRQGRGGSAEERRAAVRGVELWLTGTQRVVSRTKDNLLVHIMLVQILTWGLRAKNTWECHQTTPFDRRKGIGSAAPQKGQYSEGRQKQSNSHEPH